MGLGSLGESPAGVKLNALTDTPAVQRDSAAYATFLLGAAAATCDDARSRYRRSASDTTPGASFHLRFDRVNPRLGLCYFLGHFFYPHILFVSLDGLDGLVSSIDILYAANKIMLLVFELSI